MRNDEKAVRGVGCTAEVEVSKIGKKPEDVVNRICGGGRKIDGERDVGFEGEADDEGGKGRF